MTECCSATYDFTICRGATFYLPFRLENLPYVYKAITTIANSAPAKLTVTGHGVPDNWRVSITSAEGLTSLNTAHWPPKKKDFNVATVIDANTIELNNKITIGQPTHTPSTGYLVYFTPADLSVFNGARMQIKTAYGGDTILTLHTNDGSLIIDNVEKIIAINITADVTTDLPLSGGVYDLELFNTVDDKVTPLLSGTVSVCDEVTTIA